MNKLYTHKKPRPTSTFERLCNAFSDCLRGCKPLDPTQEDWLVRQANIFKQNKNLHTPYEIELLDQLTPQLGYDWRQASTFFVFHKTVSGIETRLVAGRELLPYQKQWLTIQRNTLLGNPITPLNNSKIKNITRATALLNYDWKVGKVNKTFIRHYQSILDTIDKPEKLSISQKKWLENQRKRYTKKETIPVDEMVKLGTLMDKLHLDWKKERERYRNKKHIKKWLKKWYSCIYCHLIENKLGIATGTLSLLHTTPLETTNDIDTASINKIHDFIVATQYATLYKASLTEKEQIVRWVQKNYFFLNPKALETTKGIPEEILKEIYTQEQVREPWVHPILTHIKHY